MGWQDALAFLCSIILIISVLMLGFSLYACYKILKNRQKEKAQIESIDPFSDTEIEQQLNGEEPSFDDPPNPETCMFIAPNQ